MNKYESVVIINPTVDEEGMKALISKFTDLINNDGKVESWWIRKKKISLWCKKFSEGFYAVFYFEANSDLIAELERNYRITDEIIKFMTVKKD